MRLLAIALLMLGCRGGHTDPDAVPGPPGDPAVCKAKREAAIDRSCIVPSDCVLVQSSDCCGVVMIAVHRGTEGSYPGVEASYQTCLACGGRGCFHADTAEDGNVPQGGQRIAPVCTANRCTSVVL